MGCKVNPWMILEGIVYGVVIVLGLMGATGLVEPKPFPVSCTNPALRKQMEDDSISLGVVGATCILLPGVVICLVEVLSRGSTTTHQTVTLQEKVLRGLSRALPLFYDLLVGGAYTFLIMEVLKVGASSPRPHFWDSCGDDICRGSYGTLMRNDDKLQMKDCPNPHKLSWMDLTDAAKSFPSGHCTFSVFAALYMTLYLHHRLNPDRVPSDGWGARDVARRWLPVMWMAWAGVVACSRMRDNRHHWWDLIGGAVLGIGMSTFTVVVLSRNFRFSSTKKRTAEAVEML